MNLEFRIKNWNWLYWTIPVFLFFAQWIFTANSMSQIRYEELAESVRNPFWLQNHTIYDGVSSNVGWYGTLLVIYKILGFTLNTAKIYRLVLSLISLFSLAALLKKFLGEKYAWIPLVTIGLSPTLLYFNTLQTSYGLDLQYFPITLYLLSTIDFKKLWNSLFKQSLVFTIAMIAWMSYPTFVFYLPILGLVYLYQIKTQKVYRNFLLLAGGILVSFISFAAPVVLAFLYVKDKNLLFYDPKVQSGIFRGAGTLYLNWGNFWQNFSGTLGDLFNSAGSYYFEVSVVDFSHLLPLLAVFFVVILGIVLTFHQKKARFPLILIWLVFITSLILANLTFDPSGKPGIRRSTSLLASVYALFTVCWYYTAKWKTENSSLKVFVVALLLIIPFHHLLAIPFNLGNLTVSSPYRYSLLFDAADTPAKSLDLFIDAARKQDLKLGCKDKDGKEATCRYVEGYAAVAGSCLWNNLNCRPILGYDDKKQEFIPLKVDLWETYYWNH